MCGIAGYYGAPKWAADPAVVLGRMVSAIRHRGPDGSGVHVNGRVGLGHARLSIIDLAGGRQPMADPTGAVWVTFNGEIFNYVELKDRLQAAGRPFRTTSDTEVILQAYLEKGPTCVEDFNGDFAFGLWDRGRDRLVLARDRMGVRPLYYAVHDGVLLFASEVKALLQAPGMRAEIDPVGLCQTFSFWYPVAPRTVFKDVYELPPGHLLVAEAGGIRVRPYWRPAFPPEGEANAPARHPDQLADELLALLTDATRIRMRADVPVGAYLSGGLDSTAVTALARTLGPCRLHTFSVGFEDSEFDERPFQLEAARALGCEHESVTVRTADIAAAFPDVVRHAERPVLRTAPAPMYRLAELVRRRGFKVVLTGEGADEVFGGYDLFKEAKVRRFWARRPDSAWRPALLTRLYPYLSGLRGQSLPHLKSFFKVGLDRPDDPFFSHRPRWATAGGTLQFFSADLRARLAGYDPVEDLRANLPAEFASWHPLARAQYLEMAHLLPGYILSSQGDRMAMAHAVETRFPFLDHRVVEFAAALPPRLKVRGLTEKYLLRKALAGRLPAAVARRPKQPYRAPDLQSFFTPGAPDYIRHLLSPTEIARTGYFDPKAVDKLVQKCRTGRPGTRDNLAVVGILSVQLLDQELVRAGGPGDPAHSPNPPHFRVTEVRTYARSG